MRRPKSIIYWLDDKPPFVKSVLLAVQQILIVAVALVIVSIIFSSANLPPRVAQNAISWSMIISGVMTLLQALKNGPVGSGYLIPPITSAIFLQASLLAIHAGGIGGLMAMTLFAGIIEIIFSQIILSIRTVFTPGVIGLIVFIVGYLLGIEGVRKAIDVGVNYHTSLFVMHILAATITLLAVVYASIWGKGMLKLMSVLFGVVIGSLFAYFVGLFPPAHLHYLSSSPIFELPHFYFPKFHFVAELSVPFILCAIAASVRVMGTIITSQQINDDEWTSPDMRSIKKGILADGIGLCLAGLLGTTGLSASPSSVGVSKLTGATSRYIAYFVAALFIFFAFIPKIVALFVIMPTAVAGGALIVNGSFMILAGIKIIQSRSVDTRTVYVVGIALLVGSSRIIFPDYYNSLPTFVNIFTGSALSITIIVALFLTIVFRFGIKKKFKTRGKHTTSSPQSFKQYVLEKISEWEIPSAVVNRAVDSGEGVLAQLYSKGIEPDQVDIEIHYDQVDLIIKFKYRGDMIKLESHSEREYYEEEAFFMGLSKLLNGIFPDEYRVSTVNNKTSLTLKFYI